jgi:membrane-bound lytic murein transglycosylase B
MIGRDVKIQNKHRHMFKKIFSAAVAALLITSAAQADYSSHPGAAAFVKTMVEEHNFDRDWVLAILKQSEAKQSILDAMSRPAESVMTWERYRKIFIQDSRVTQGVEFWKEHLEELTRAEKQFGVPASMIVGIIGVETRYGRNKGSFRVVDALATLGFDFPRRSSFFLGQLEEYMLMVREQGIEPFSLKGSYAGAMGYGQFIPSSYRAYAVDFDGDGKVDIVNSSVDAVGSVANYFKRHGWRLNEPVVSSAVVKDGVDESFFNAGLKPEKTIAELRAAGITGDRALAPERKATAMKLDGDKGDEYWIGLQNFYVITRYNHSSMYAMAAYQLSELIADEMAKVTAP